jgi:hypothetical protein
MDSCQTWFTHRGIYTFPDGTPLIALWTELGDCPHWWFVAQHDYIPGRFGDLQLIVYPSGRVYTCVPEPDQGKPAIFIPVASDLCIEDLRPMSVVIGIAPVEDRD